MHNNKKLTGKERDFLPEEIFYSVTDKKSKITDFNEVFVRISGFQEAELLGSPHKIIRHPAMPRAVFSLMWETIPLYKNFGGYVNNCAKNGDNYWVFAFVTPVHQSYFSVRLKPTSQLLQVVKDIYNEALHEELKHQDLMEQIDAGKRVILTRLEKLGYPSYDEFWEEALILELESRLSNWDRARLLKVYNSDDFYIFSIENVLKSYSYCINTYKLVKNLKTIFGEVTNACVSLKRLALNLSIRAKKLGDKGRTLDCLSGEVSRLTERISASTHEMQQSADFLYKFTLSYLLPLSQILIVNEGVLRRQFEEKWFGKRMPEETIKLTNHIKERIVKISRQLILSGLDQNLAKLDSLLRDILRFDKTLEFISVSGKAEASRLNDSDAFYALLNQVQDQAKKMKEVYQFLSDFYVTFSALFFLGKSTFTEEHSSQALT